VQVFAFVQGGVRYALPQPRVARVATAPTAGAELVALSERSVGEWEVCIEVSSGGADRFWVPCEHAGLVDLDEPKPIPPLLRDAMGLPHVIGWAELDGGFVWLLDARRLAR
jgi:hypothetical protein